MKQGRPEGFVGREWFRYCGTFPPTIAARRSATIRALQSGGRNGRLILFALVFALSVSPAVGATNLVRNGSFDDPADRLAGWKYRYDRPGESWYAENHTRVSVVDKDGARTTVLRLHGTDAILNVPGQGVQVNSKPIPVDINGKFRFSAWVRGTGPQCRILLEGYRWSPRVKPHPDPELHELRKCYRFSLLYFGAEQAGETSPAGREWKQASMTFPSPNPSELARQSLKEIQFLVVHIVAIAGSEGDLFVDDVRIEPVEDTSADSSGARHADGAAWPQGVGRDGFLSVGREGSQTFAPHRLTAGRFSTVPALQVGSASSVAARAVG